MVRKLVPYEVILVALIFFYCHGNQNSCRLHWAKLALRWTRELIILIDSVLSTGYISIQGTMQLFPLTRIHCIVIYLMESAIQRLNGQGLRMYTFKTVEKNICKSIMIPLACGT